MLFEKDWLFFFPQRPRWSLGFSLIAVISEVSLVTSSCPREPRPLSSLRFSKLSPYSLCSPGSHKGENRKKKKSIPFTGFLQNIDHLPGLAFANESILETQEGAVEAPCKNKNKHNIDEEERCHHREECSVGSVSFSFSGWAGWRTPKLPGQHRLSLLLL